MSGLAVGAYLIFALGCTGWETGYAVRYSEHRMEHVAHNRQIPQQPCMVAWTAARDTDVSTTWLRVAGPGGAMDCLVADVPQHVDRAALSRRGIIVELGYANRWICGAGWSGRAKDCKVRVIPIQ